MPRRKAEQYLGRYVVVSPGRPDAELLLTLVNDGAEHWSLAVQEGELPMYKLIPVAPDSFVQQLDDKRRVVFVRGDSGVIAIELSGRERTRRGQKVLTAKRD